MDRKTALKIITVCAAGAAAILINIIAYHLIFAGYPLDSEDRLAGYYNTLITVKSILVTGAFIETLIIANIVLRRK